MKGIFARKILPIMLLMLSLNMIIMSIGTTPVSAITQANSTPVVYLDPPTLNGTLIGVNNTVTVDVMISDAVDISGWMVGLLFDASLLECTDFSEGEFLSDVGPAVSLPGTINNTLGLVEPYGWAFLGDYMASGNGRLAYLTFRVKAPGISDLHLRDVTLVDYYTLDETASDIIDVYTVVEATPPQTVVIESNSTGTAGGEYNSGFSGHSFDNETEEIMFNVTGPHSGFSSVSIPKTLLSVDSLDDWSVFVDGVQLGTTQRTVSENATHYSISFTYAAGVHSIGITSRELSSSTISVNLDSTSVAVESDVVISGAIDPVRADVTVTIEYRSSGGTWTTLATSVTDSSSSYSYTWTAQEAGTYEIRARWDGDANTEGAVSDVKTLTVKETGVGIDPYILAAVAGVIILVLAVVVYFVKIRKPEEE